MLVVEICRPLVEQQADVAQAVDVLVEVDVGILESVFRSPCRVDTAYACVLGNGALLLAEVVAYIVER